MKCHIDPSSIEHRVLVVDRDGSVELRTESHCTHMCLLFTDVDGRHEVIHEVED